MAPLGKVAGRRVQWLTRVAAYTLAGGAASAAVGALLGLSGRLLIPESVGSLGTAIALACALLALARDAGWIAIPLPQWRRQTRRTWSVAFPAPVAAALWGFDLGLVFTTWTTFAGVWLLAVLGFMGGEPVFGVALFVSYWFGRASSVWLGPILLSDPRATPYLMEEVVAQRGLFRRLEAIGIVWAAFVLGVGLVQGLPLAR